MPVSGIRETYKQMIFSTKCRLFGSNNSDRQLKAYSVCAIELTPVEFALNDNEPIEMYINHPGRIYSYIETCEMADEQRCWTDTLVPGIDYMFYPSDKYSVRMIF